MAAPDADNSDAPRRPAPPKGSGGRTTAILLVTALFCGQVYFLLNADHGPTPAQQLQDALTRLDEGKEVRARDLASKLLEAGYRDPDFAGGTEFVMGIVAFREAEGLDEVGREQRFIVAASFLREAEERAVIDQRRPEWAYAFGVSLHQIGRALEARPLLEEAIRTYPPGKVPTSLMLAETYLHLNEPELLQKALDLNATVTGTPDLAVTIQDQAYLQRAQILLALKRNDDAEKALTKVSDNSNSNYGTAVLRAQTYISEGKYREALQLLEPVSRDVGLERTYPRQASYLMGVCAQMLGDQDSAVSHFERTAKRYERSHEALAASLAAGDIMRVLGRNEEALDSYGQALRMVRKPENFRNKWIDLEHFRRNILQAWKDWGDQQRFAEAIALAEMMSPLFPRDQADELAALAHQRWAEQLESQMQALPYSERGAQVQNVQRHWNQSGAAYAKLAQSRTASAEYPEALWTSAEHYMRGHDFINAAAEFTRFVDTNPSKLLPTALVRRGQAMLHLNRLDEALEHFQQVVTDHPTDPASFEARYLTGLCHLERQDYPAAEKVWRGILESPELTPAAQEWRDSLFSLGKLLATTAGAQRHVVQQAQLQRPADAERLQTENFARWNDAIATFEQFLDRYPSQSHSSEARYLLAESLENSAEFLEWRLATAETENARTDFRRKIAERLDAAIHEFTRLEEELRKQAEADQLDAVGQVLLRNCYFESAHVHFRLGRYAQAIESYSTAVTRYQLQAETLTAYVQMANCYERLGKLAEARSMLEQAKVILGQIPDDAFKSAASSMNREEWKYWLQWAMNLNR